jgi:hypothetical protein
LRTNIVESYGRSRLDVFDAFFVFFFAVRIGFAARNRNPSRPLPRADSQKAPSAQLEELNDEPGWTHPL